MRISDHGAAVRRVVLHNDDATPVEFVHELLEVVFDMDREEAQSFARYIGREGKASLGAFPLTVAEAFVKASRQCIEAAGHPLRIALESLRGGRSADSPCSFCGRLPQESSHTLVSDEALICEACLLKGARGLTRGVSGAAFKYAYEALAWHFAGLAADEIVTVSRVFPGHMRADAQIALDALFSRDAVRFFGLHEPHRYETLSYSTLSKEWQHATTIASAQFVAIDVGADEPVRCLENGLWLRQEAELRYAVVLSSHREHGQETGTRVEIAVPAGADGVALTERKFTALEAAIQEGRSYRGKVLSLDVDTDYRGRAHGVTVHRLPKVARDDVILPEPTLSLIDRNIFQFVARREALRALGQSTRKGVLLYGPPGTGKTHTIRYLAGNLPGHTTLLITAAQMGLIRAYMNLARLLQPSIVVIEDVDLIARAREDMNSPCEESLLNSLLNEMDGLKPDADILFVLTTNRPEQLEAALAGRPGRIDQAIEVPLPDAAGRAKLARLYGAGLDLSETVIEEAARRTEGVSAAFIRELMRRSAQATIARGSGKALLSADLSEALDDMLFTGGRLNLELLGGAGVARMQS